MLVDSQKDPILYSDAALLGCDEPITGFEPHAVLGSPIEPPYPPHCECALFGMGCFWAAEQLFWQVKGVHTTAVGYCAGSTPNPEFQEICTGLTGHNEAVMVVFDPQQLSYADLLQFFWENHNPTQGLRQGNDVGSQFRSGIYPLTPAQHFLAKQSLDEYRQKVQISDRSVVTKNTSKSAAVTQAKHTAASAELSLSVDNTAVTVTTEIINSPPFYFAEQFHQQYLIKNPHGYAIMQNIKVTGLPPLR